MLGQVVEVRGRVVDRSNGAPIERGTVRVDSASTSVGSGGTFRLRVPVGARSIIVRALGYAPWQTTVRFERDTSITVDLEPRPFELDTVRAEARMVHANITIRDSANRQLVPDVEVATNIGGKKNSGHRGVVSVEVPIGDPIQAYFTAFGYLPVLLPLELRRDSSMTLWLRADPVVKKLIERQIGLLQGRMKGRVATGKSIMAREELVKVSDAGMYEVLKREGFLRRLACVVIDDVQPTIPVRFALDAILPDRVERVERLVFGDGGIMVRVYTREYVRDLMLERAGLRDIVYVGPPGKKLCR